MLNINEYHRKWRANNPEKVKAAFRKWQKANPEKVRQNARNHRKTWSPEKRAKVAATQRRNKFKRDYGITVDDYEAMLISQNGHCALCSRTPQQEHHKRLNVDHVHGTKIVRGLLYTPCNHALGVLGDTKEKLQKAAEYCFV